MKLSLMPLIKFTLSVMMMNQTNATPICSNDCCIVKYMLQQFGKPVNQSNSIDNCCYPTFNITCDSSRKVVTQINWGSKGLSGRIPNYIGNLSNLTQLNRLSGEIPKELLSIKTLKRLDLSGNGLSGDIGFLQNFTSLTALNLRGNINLRGSLVLENLAAYHRKNPHIFLGTGIILSTSDESNGLIETFANPFSAKDLRDLASYPLNGTNSLKKRAVVASFPTNFGTFTCATNPTTGRPYQDCLNTVAAFCQTSSPLFSDWSECQSKVKTVRDNINQNWKDYVNSCAKFAGGNPSSSGCNSSTSRILTNEVFYYHDDSGNMKTSYIPRSVTDAIAYIWYT